MFHVDALAPGLAVPVAGRLAPRAPDDWVVRFGLGVAGTQHVGEIKADGGPNALLVEPGEARPEVSAAPALDDDLVGQIAGGVLGGVLKSGVDLEDVDALGLDLGRDLAAPRSRSPRASGPAASPRCR